MSLRLTALIPGFDARRANRLPWKYFAEVLTHIDQAGWDVCVITDSASEVDGWATEHVRSAFPLSPWGARRLARRINRRRPDVVLAPMGPTSLAHRRLLSSLMAPVVGVVLQYPYQTPQIPWTRMVHRETLEQAWLAGLGSLVPDPLKAWGLRYGARLIVSSRATEERLTELGVTRDFVRYAPPGLDPAAFERPREADAPDHARILYFGSCLRLRGTDRVLEAFQVVRRNHPDLELVILDRGDGGYDIEGALKREGMDEGVNLVRDTLSAREVRAWIAGSTVALLPFRMAVQDTPLTILEAQALGTPVVACDVPGVGETVEAPGIVVPSGDEAALVRAVKEVLRLHPISASLRGSLARRTRSRIPTWEETASTVKATLEELV